MDPLERPKSKNTISEDTYNELRPAGSKLGTLYWSAKVHERLKIELPLFKPNLLAIGIPIYKMAKFLVPVLSNITQNEFTVNDSFTFLMIFQNFEF